MTRGSVLAITILVMFLLLAIAEFLWPARRVASGERHRIAINFGLGALNMALAAIPLMTAYTSAVLAQDRDWGLLNSHPLPATLTAALVFLILSFIGYVVHVAHHKVDRLWRWHIVHHNDLAVDLSTSLRTHPFSAIVISLVIAPAMLLLGPPPAIVDICSTVIFIGGLWHHSNIHINDAWSARLEWFIVTPRMHLVHHARERTLHDSNYGDIISLWDRVFGTYRLPPPDPVTIGALAPASAPAPAQR